MSERWQVFDLLSFGLSFHVGQLHRGVVVSFFALCPIAKLDRFLGAPLQACETLLAAAQPGGASADHLDITNWADSGTNPATAAVFIAVEGIIHAQAAFEKGTLVVSGTAR